MNDKKELRFTFQSCADLNDIWESLATAGTMWRSFDPDNLSKAEAFSKMFEQLCDVLGAYPDLGADRSDLHAGLRSFLFHRYLVFYRLRGESIEVIRILGASTDAAVPALA